MAFEDVMDGRYLEKLTQRDLEDNRVWLRSRMAGTSPVRRIAPTAEQVDGWWDGFLATSAADASKILFSGLTFGIVQPKHLGTLGAIIEKHATPDERKSALRKIAEFGAEMLVGLPVGGALLGPVGRAAAGILPRTVGAVGRGAVKGATEGALIGAGHVGMEAIRGEATPGSALAHLGTGAVFGGALGAAFGKYESLIQRRVTAKIEAEQATKLRTEAEQKAAATKASAEARLGEAAREAAEAGPTIAQRQAATELAGREAVLAETAAVDQYESELMAWAKKLEVVTPARATRVALEAESTSGSAVLGLPREAGPSVVGQTPIPLGTGEVRVPIPMGAGETRTPIPMGSPPIPLGPTRTPIAALPPAPEVPIPETIDPRKLLKLADSIESSFEGKSQKYKDTLRPKVQELREQAMVLQVTDSAVEAIREIKTHKNWPQWRQALIKGGMTGNVESTLAASLGQAAAGALVGAPLGAATAESPEDRWKNAIAGAVVGAAAVPGLVRALSGAMAKKTATLAGAAPESMPSAQPREAVTPMAAPTTRVRVEAIDTPTAERLVEELGGQVQRVAGFVFHVPWAERASRQELAQSVQALTKVLETRVGSARIGPVSDSLLNEMASKYELGDLLSKRLGEGWNRFEAAALGMHMRAADDAFWTLLESAKNDPAALIEFKRASGVLLSLTRTLFGATSEWGYAGHVWQAVQETTPQARNSVRMLSQLLGTDAAEQQLKLGVSPKRFHEMMMALVEQRGQSERIIGWSTFTRQIEHGVVEAWINGLLSNPVTHAANLLGNILPVFAGPAERWMAARFSTGAIGSVVPGEGTEMLFGLWSGFGDAFKAASRSFRTGISAWDALATKIELPRKAISAEAFGLTEGEVLGRGIDLLGEVVRTPGRALTAADDFFKMLNYRMELHALTYRAAKMAHPSGGDDFAKALAQLRRDPTNEILEQAFKFSEVQTFTNPLGDFGNALQRLSNSHPSVKLVLPFIRTPINLVKYAWERMPGLNLLSAQVRADLTVGGAARDLAIAKMALGGMIASTAAVFAAGGFLTGKGPSDKALLESLRLTGWQPYSIKIGDTYYAFSRLDPIGMTLGAVADFTDLAGHLPENSMAELSQAIGLSMIRNVTSKTWMQGVANVMEALTDQDGRHLNTFFNLQGQSLIPAFVAQVNRSLVDPEIHEVHSFLDALRSRIPGLSGSLPPRRNLWADPILLEGGLGPDIASPIYTRKVAGDKVAEEISANRISVSLPPDYIYGYHPAESITVEQRVSQGVKLTPEQRDRWITLMGKGVRDASGRTLRDALENLIASEAYRKASPGPDGMKALYVQQAVEYFRQAARQQMLYEMPDLQAQVNARRAARTAARVGAM